MKVEYSSKITQVSEVLLQFRPTRLKKALEVSVAKFTHNWLEQLPECMKSEKDDEFRSFADLIKWSLYYHCLKDQYIHKELCELSKDDSNFKRFFDQAVMAESKRKSFLDIGISRAKLDPAGGITVNKVDAASGKKEVECYNCGQFGHYASTCKSGKSQKSGRGGKNSSN